MIITIKENASESTIKALEDYVQSKNLMLEIAQGNNMRIAIVIGDTSLLDDNAIRSFDCVSDLKRLTHPYKLVSRDYQKEDTVIDVCGIKIGQHEKIVMIGGPCSIESEETAIEIAQGVKEAGGTIFRGGAYKARTSPYSFQGLREKGLEDLAKVRKIVKMPIVSEILSTDQLDDFVKNVDIIQVGARNMQNYELLKALGKIDKPILLKRGYAATIEELLMAAEYILLGGNKKVILCERGIRTFAKATRNTLDISAVPYIKKVSHLPVIVDPSHGTGKRDLVEPMTLAAIAAGADGVMIEVHNNPQFAWSDGAQCVNFAEYNRIVEKARLVAKAVGREIY